MWHSLSLIKSNRMSITFVSFGCIFPFHTASAMALYVCNGVGGCLCPIYSNIILVYTTSRAMMYSAASSASVADVMTCLITCVMLKIVPLLWGIVVLLDKKKFLTAQLLAFGSLS